MVMISIIVYVNLLISITTIFNCTMVIIISNLGMLRCEDRTETDINQRVPRCFNLLGRRDCMVLYQELHHGRIVIGKTQRQHRF